MVTSPYSLFAHQRNNSDAYLTINPEGVSLALYSGITIDGAVGCSKTKRSLGLGKRTSKNKQVHEAKAQANHLAVLRYNGWRIGLEIQVVATRLGRETYVHWHDLPGGKFRSPNGAALEFDLDSARHIGSQFAGQMEVATNLALIDEVASPPAQRHVPFSVFSGQIQPRLLTIWAASTE